MITKQEIIDCIEALGVEHSAAYDLERARIANEKNRLQELCANIGHVFAKVSWPVSFGRECVYCGAHEPTKAAGRSASVTL